VGVTGSIIAFGTLELIDGFLTVWATNHQFEEVNPLTAPIASSWMFPLLKIGLVILAIALTMPFVRRFPRQVSFGFTSISLFLVLVLASNVFEMVG